MPAPIQKMAGISLTPSEFDGIARIVVTDSAEKTNLSWDRFVRLRAAAEALRGADLGTVLDAGGFDGALAFFFDRTLSIELLDPLTTGGSVLAIPAPDRHYDAVVAVDVLEHIEPEKRSRALDELTRVAQKVLVLNYPNAASRAAQEVALRLTNNALIKEHVDWPLPESDWVVAELARRGFAAHVTEHTSTAVWLGQYVTLNLLPDAARELNRYLVANCADEPTSQPLYHLVVAERA